MGLACSKSDRWEVAVRLELPKEHLSQRIEDCASSRVKAHDGQPATVDAHLPYFPLPKLQCAGFLSFDDLSDVAQPCVIAFSFWTRKPEAMDCQKRQKPQDSPLESYSSGCNKREQQTTLLRSAPVLGGEARGDGR